MRRRGAGLPIIALALTGCGSLAVTTCPPGQQAMLSTELLFGRKIGDRVGVSDAAFAGFLAAEITPRFPEGLTVIDAQGQWRDAGRVVREPSKIVRLVHAGTPARQAAIEAIAAAYKRRFRQQSVGVVSRPVCAAF